MRKTTRVVVALDLADNTEERITIKAAARLVSLYQHRYEARSEGGIYLLNAAGDRIMALWI